jgi:glycosyltransferase involved in cell wall biosynthesis
VTDQKRQAVSRIIHLAPDLRLGGTQNMLLSRVRGCSGYEHHVWVAGRPVRRDAPEISERLSAAGAKLRISGAGPVASWGWFLGGLARARLMRPAIVHSCTYQTHIVAPHIASAGGAALIVSKEGTDDWMTEKQARRELSIANEAAAVVAVSKAAAESLRRAGRVLSPIHIVPCGIPPGPPSWSVLPEEDESTTVLYVGRLDPAKGLADLVEATWRLIDSGRNLRLQIQGDGPAEGALREACARPPLSGRARVITAADLARTPAEEKRARGPVLFVLPSRHEGFGVVLLEAMRLGLPIIATRVGGIPEVVEEGIQAILVPPRDTGGLMEAIARLLDDEALRTRLGAAGPARAGEFTERTMCEAWSRIYADVAGVEQPS